jgi:TonB family protein
MTRTGFTAGPNAHLLIGEMPAPRQMAARWREGTGVSIGAHAVAFGILLYAATHVNQVAQTAAYVTGPARLIFAGLPARGGSGPGTTGSPPQVEIPTSRPVPLAVTPTPADTPPIPELNIPVITEHANQTLPGALTAMDTTSPAKGWGPGAEGGRGPGSGPGEGPSGRGDGPLAGFGGVVPPGYGVTPPQLINDVKPNYTVDAMRAKVQGIVLLQAVVLPDGSVDPSRIRITRSLDAGLGLDQQAIAAVKQWRFRPGVQRGQAVAMWVDVELTFRLR